MLTAIPRPLPHTEISPRTLAWMAALVGPLVVWSAASLVLAQVRPGSVCGLHSVVCAMLATCACYTDLRWRLLPNWLTYSAALWGLALAGWGTLFPFLGEVAGGVSLGDSLAGLLMLFVAMLAVFSVTGGGGGDVKVSGAIGALLGLEAGFEALLVGFLTAGFVLLVFAVATIGPQRIVQGLLQRIAGPGPWSPATDPREDLRQLLRAQTPLGPFFAVGILVAEFGGRSLLLAY